MNLEQSLTQHYAHGSLQQAIFNALLAAGKDVSRLELADLAPVDEFHIGSRRATIDFAEQFGVQHRIRHDGKGFAFHRHRKRLVPADVIDVIDESQVLKNAQSVRRAAQPERIEANRTSAGDPLDGIDAGLISRPFLLGSHGILRLPGLAVSRRLMAAIDKFRGLIFANRQ
jgi:hypothetical protein